MIEDEIIKHRDHLEEIVKERTYVLNVFAEHLQNEITERKRIELSLRESQCRLQAIIDNAPVYIYQKDKMGRYVLVNKKFEFLTGCCSEDSLGKTDYDIFPKEVADVLRENDLRVMNEKAPLKLEEVAIHKLDSSVHTYVSNKFPLFDSKGEVCGICGISSDVSERKFYEEKLRLFSQAVEESMDGVAIIDLNRRIMYSNRGIEEMLGYTCEECIGMDANVFLVDTEFTDTVILPQVLKEGRWSGEVVSKHKKGQNIAVWLTLSLVKDDKGEPIAYLGISKDITQRKLREAEIEKINACLELRVQEEVAKNRQKDLIMLHQSRLAAMGEMIGHIAHQWRQPLTALGIIIFNLKDSFYHDELDDEILEQLVGQGDTLIQKMSTTIDDFRNFFKPGRQKEYFHVNKIIEDTVSLVNTGFKSSNITVLFEENRDVTVYGFPNEYSQVILNLISNARDAIVGQKKHDGLIDIKLSENEISAMVKISDNGGGIPEEIINIIFDPYFTTKEQGKGTGIGLYMSKMIIEEHMKGRIEVHNTGTGAEFMIITPKRGKDNG